MSQIVFNVPNQYPTHKDTRLTADFIVRTFDNLYKYPKKPNITEQQFFTHLLDKSNIKSEVIYEAIAILLDHPTYHKKIGNALFTMARNNPDIYSKLDTPIKKYVESKKSGNSKELTFTLTMLISDLRIDVQSEHLSGKQLKTEHQNSRKLDRSFEIRQELPEAPKLQSTQAPRTNHNLDSIEITKLIKHDQIVDTFRRYFNDKNYLQKYNITPYNFFNSLFKKNKDHTDETCMALITLLDDPQFSRQIDDVIHKLHHREIISFFYLETNLYKYIDKYHLQNDNYKSNYTYSFIQLLNYFEADRKIKSLPPLGNKKYIESILDSGKGQDGKFSINYGLHMPSFHQPEPRTTIIHSTSPISNKTRLEINHEEQSIEKNKKYDMDDKSNEPVIDSCLYDYLGNFNKNPDEEIDLIDNRFRCDRSGMISQAYKFFNYNINKQKIHPTILLLASMHAMDIKDKVFLERYFTNNTGFQSFTKKPTSLLDLNNPINIKLLTLFQTQKINKLPYFTYDVRNQDELFDNVGRFCKSYSKITIITLHERGNYSHIVLKKDSKGDISAGLLLNPLKSKNFLQGSDMMDRFEGIKKILQRHTPDLDWKQMHSTNQINSQIPKLTDQQTLLKNFHNAGGIFGLMLEEHLQINDHEIQDDLTGFDIVESFERSLKSQRGLRKSGTNLDFRWKLLKLAHEYRRD